MTLAELIAARGEPDQKTSDAVMYVDSVDGARVPTAYAFLEGHLAQVTSQFAPLALNPSALEKALTLKYGPPTWDHDKATELDKARQAAERADVALAILGAAELAANLASASPATFYPYTWLSFRDSRELRRALETQAKPARDVMWSTAETRVHWVKLDSGYSTVNWGKRCFGAEARRSTGERRWPRGAQQRSLSHRPRHLQPAACASRSGRVAAAPPNRTSSARRPTATSDSHTRSATSRCTSCIHTGALSAT